jgi:hypothetical protein
MAFQIMATASFFVGLAASTLGNSPIAAAGAFVGAGLFAIASALQTRK